MFYLILFAKQQNEFDTPSPSWNPTVVPDWPTISPEWPNDPNPEPEWPSASEEWPNVPYTIPEPTDKPVSPSHLSKKQILLISIFSGVAGVAIIAIGVILILRRKKRTKEGIVKDGAFSAQTETLLQNTDDL